MALAIRPFLPYSYNHFVTELVSLHKSRFSQFLGDPGDSLYNQLFSQSFSSPYTEAPVVVGSLWRAGRRWSCVRMTRSRGQIRAETTEPRIVSCPQVVPELSRVHTSTANTALGEFIPWNTQKKTFLNLPQAYFKHLQLSLFIKFLVHLF